jgi:hypothetical protein
LNIHLRHRLGPLFDVTHSIFLAQQDTPDPGDRAPVLGLDGNGAETKRKAWYPPFGKMSNNKYNELHELIELDGMISNSDPSPHGSPHLSYPKEWPARNAIWQIR